MMAMVLKKSFARKTVAAVSGMVLQVQVRTVHPKDADAYEAKKSNARQEQKAKQWYIPIRRFPSGIVGRLPEVVCCCSLRAAYLVRMWVRGRPVARLRMKEADRQLADELPKGWVML
jgi:hypothetical protein